MFTESLISAFRCQGHPLPSWEDLNVSRHSSWTPGLESHQVKRLKAAPHLTLELLLAPSCYGAALANVLRLCLKYTLALKIKDRDEKLISLGPWVIVLTGRSHSGKCLNTDFWGLPNTAL
jgi:hypothetical protein